MNMRHLGSILSIVGALALAAFVITFSDGVTNLPAAVDTYNASTTLPIIPVQRHTTVASPPSAAKALQAALVNILCSAPSTGNIRSISASGVLIDSKGIILTNAHVAQYFLLADRGVSCVIRTGSPAADSYKASLIYISPQWLQANPSVLAETAPSGTGQYDFALLAVTASANASVLPTAFPFIPLASDAPSLGAPVVISSYAAQSLKSTQIQSHLAPTIVIGSVKDVFTYGFNSVDVVALGGSAAAQEGSSGGGVADSSGQLVAMLTTSTISGATSSRSLDAITASYIRNEYESETGQPVSALLTQLPSTAAASFAPKIPALEAIIARYLP